MQVIACFLCWSAYLSIVLGVFLKGLKAIRGNVYAGQVGFLRKRTAYTVSGKAAVLFGKTYVMAAFFLGFALVSPILIAALGGSDEMAGGFAGWGCCLAVSALILGNIMIVKSANHP